MKEINYKGFILNPEIVGSTIRWHVYLSSGIKLTSHGYYSRSEAERFCNDGTCKEAMTRHREEIEVAQRDANTVGYY
ncbi:MAG TPA: hypothetical protein VI358_18180 [Pseudolabrys sp.]